MKKIKIKRKNQGENTSPFNTEPYKMTLERKKKLMK